ncbi:MAG: pyridoxal phosphate-dependent aminotransferase [Christensenellales bacterium]
MEYSVIASAVVGSLTLEVDAKAKKMKAEGHDIVGFGAGEPDFDTPEFIKEAAVEALHKGLTKYTPASGLLELKQAICENLKKRQSLEYKPEDIVVSNGAKHSLFNIFAAILNPGDEVIIPAPYWVSYPEMVKMVGGVPVFVETLEEKGFQLDVKAVFKAISRRTKAIVINSPNNPTGAVFCRDSIAQVARLAVENDFMIISDEIYADLIYDGTHISPAGLGEAEKAHTVLVNGMSKSYSMTGWRIGYSACDAKLAKIMGDYQSHTTSNPNTIAQYASVAALKGSRAELENMKAEFDRRRKALYNGIQEIPGLSCHLPEGAFYIFMKISGLYGKKCDGKVIRNSMEFVQLLLEKDKVAIVPGIAFGADGYARLSYATSMKNIEKGLAGIRRFVESLT